jgi:hypothetical protein
VTDPALIFPVPGVLRIEMAEETDVDRYPHMFSLNYIGVAAPAVKTYPPRLPREVRLVVKDDIPSRQIFGRFYQSSIVAAGLQAFPIRHVSERPGIVSPHKEPELARQSLHRAVLMALQAGHHVVRRPLPLVVEGFDKMTTLAYGRIRDHDFAQKKITDNQKGQ